MDRLTKIVWFLSVKVTFTLDKLAKLYVDKIISQYGTPVSIVSNRDLRFTSKFWPSLQEALETKLHFCTGDVCHKTNDVVIFLSPSRLEGYQGRGVTISLHLKPSQTSKT